MLILNEGRMTFKIVTGEPTGKRLLGRPWRKLKANIRMNLREMGVNTRN